MVLHKKKSYTRNSTDCLGEQSHEAGRAATKMSWMGKKPGRRKEEGGHHRIDLSLSDRVQRILDVPDNRSKYVEDCVKTCTEITWIVFNEPGVVMNGSNYAAKVAAAFPWYPNDSKHNVIVSLFFAFQYRCTGGGIRFRVRINDLVTSFVDVRGSPTWSFSPVYSDSCFVDGLKVKPDQECYVIELQFEPLRASNCVFVRDVYVFCEVVDGLPAFES